jgi:tetratricopeptide (TPR) repeat protein
MFGEEHADTAWSYYNLAFVLINHGKFAEAEENICQVLQKRGANLPAEHPVIGSCLLLLGHILMAQERFLEARGVFLECLDLRRNTLPEDHWLLASTRSFLGECLIYLGETEKGLQMMRENCRIIKEKLGVNHEQTRQAFERLKKFSD